MNVLKSKTSIFDEILSQIGTKRLVWPSEGQESGSGQLNNVLVGKTELEEARQQELSKELIKALKEDNKKKAKSLIKQLSNLKNVFDESSSGSLHYVARSGNLDVALDLLDKGADLKKSDIYGWTPLHAAAFWGRTELVAILLDRGADIKAVDNNGFSPLHLASQVGYRQVVEVLLEYQKDRKMDIINSTDHNFMTPLHIAAFSAKEQIVELLIEWGAKVDTRDINGDTPIRDAESAGSQVITKLLKQALDRELNLDLTNSYPKLDIGQPHARKLDLESHDKFTNRDL